MTADGLTSHPLRGAARLRAFAGREGIIIVKMDEMPGLPGTATATLYDLAQFRVLIAELTAVADDCEAQLGLPLHGLPTDQSAAS